ncbi:MAG TPA: biotin transporter BioY [Gemmatimonadaceae bacterium]|jgi:biotin transport system substrate-specific component|nr:biotin transporter BioY [Gemmatimonadaceae bacterium]
MTSPSLSIARDRRVAALMVVGFAGALAVASQVAIRLPGTPVPMTLQPLVVVLAGLWLGPTLGAASMIVYLLAGAMGAPVFAPIPELPQGIARFAGPTGGYLWAYPVAAWIAGTVGQRWPSFVGRTLASAAGIVALHVGGVAQLMVLTGSATTAASLGTLPFLAMDVVKSLLGGALSSKRSTRTIA